MSVFHFNGSDFRTGDFVVCEITGVEIEKARIFVATDSKVYICQNVKDGSASPDMLGFNYSWVTHKKSRTELSDAVTNLRHAPPNYYGTPRVSEYQTRLISGAGGGLRVRS